MDLVPHLTTDRLLLREARREDFEAFASIVMDPHRPIPPGPMDRRTAWRVFIATQGQWIVDGVGQWAVEERASGEYVGHAGAFRREPPPGPCDPDEIELAWTFVERFRGRGFATEAIRAVVDHVFETRKPPRVIAHVDHDNAPSIRVAEKLGMRYEREVAFYENRLRRYVLER